MTPTLAPDFELPNAGAGPDPYRLADRAAADDVDFVVLLFQRDYHCGNCREQVQQVAERYEEFVARNAEVASVLPEPRERAASWQDSYGLPFALLADESKAVGDDYDQPTRFGVLGSLHDLVGRMPETVVLDVRGDEPTVAYEHRGSSPSDRPSVDELLAEIDALA
ncbi:peroxiredoxin family protein [Halobacterium jilantaiense]|uniref:Peroxiredoxin Q/BCP n=1 Tax=Halobacterium jilantaiense TaxID=355548 RepID=A0A1I0MSL1_9EURY|nr:redoxin domain-containing protein [Halobacterium jilantaiense]SEV91028.1 peroxiredoxin Q/BCP [Halobacterium jilantaiense]